MARAARPKHTATARDGDTPASSWLENPRFWAAGIFLITCVAFAPLFISEFTNIDDPATIANNPKLNPPTLASLLEFWDPHKPQMDLYVPVTYTVWSALARLAWVPTPDPAGIHLNPWVFHGANVVFHALSALMVFQILRTLVRPMPVAALGGLIFALHPVQVEPVGWASGTKDVLCGLFSLIALWGYLRHAQLSAPVSSDHHPGDPENSSLRTAPTPGRSGPGLARPGYQIPPKQWSPFHSPRFCYCLGAAALILAMLSKPTAVVTPLIAAALDLLVLRRRFRLVLGSIWPWMLLVVPVLIEGRLVQPAPGDYAVPFLLRPLIATDALAFYLSKLFWPARLGFIYNRSPQAVISHGWLWWTWIIPAAALLAVLAPLASRTVRRSPGAVRPAAALAVFWIGVLPVLGMVPFDFQQFSTTADHYLYLAMLGPALAAAFVLSSLARAYLTPSLGTPGEGGGGGFETVNVDRKSPPPYPPPEYRGRENIGRSKRSPKKGATLARASTTAACIALLAVLAMRSFFQARHWHDSFTLLEHAIAVNPWSPYLYDNLSKACADENLPEEARRWDEESVRRWPARAASHLNLASDFLLLNHPAEAEVEFKTVLRLDPTFEAARRQLAELEGQRATKPNPSPNERH